MRIIASTIFLISLISSSACFSEGKDSKLLETTLTPSGAERAGNSSGSIPAWSGGMLKGVAEISAEGSYANPFYDEKPLVVIDINNYIQHQDFLTEGQIAMLKRYEGYYIPVYQTHRSTRLPEKYNNQTKINLNTVVLNEDGYGLRNYEYAVPFAIPDHPLEVLWNHLTRYRGGSINREFATALVGSNGEKNIVTYHHWVAFREAFTDLPDGDNRLNNAFIRTLSPARFASTATLVQDSLDMTRNDRAAWQYNPGQRRVRRAPTLAYDASARHGAGIITTDSVDGFTGKPDRYDWSLQGKKELYIGYNAYDLGDKSISYDQLLNNDYLNPELTRYEKHRVWVLDADLKPGQRHMYAKRRFYIDEDSWQIMAVDIYDSKKILWRVFESHLIQMHDSDTPITIIEGTFDLMSGQYATNFMINETKSAARFGLPASINDFTPNALRRSGR